MIRKKAAMDFPGISLPLFLTAATEPKMSAPFHPFFLLLLPAFLARIVCSEMFKGLPKVVSNSTHREYRELPPAQLHLSSFMLRYIGAPNRVRFLSVIVFGTALIFGYSGIEELRLRNLPSVSDVT